MRNLDSSTISEATLKGLMNEYILAEIIAGAGCIPSNFTSQQVQEFIEPVNKLFQARSYDGDPKTIIEFNDFAAQKQTILEVMQKLLQATMMNAAEYHCMNSEHLVLTPNSIYLCNSPEEAITKKRKICKQAQQKQNRRISVLLALLIFLTLVFSSLIYVTQY